jgi:hypothetical protein
MEWRAPVLSQQPLLAALFALLPLLLILAVSQKRLGAAALLLAAAIPAWLHLRLSPFFCLASAFYAPVLLSSSPSFRLQPKLEPALKNLAIALLLFSGAWMATRERLFTQAVDKAQFPIEAAGFLKSNPPQSPLGNLFKDGAYLIFSLAPQTKIFIDSRVINYPNSVFKDSVALEAAHPAWPQIFKKYGIESMLLPLQSRLAAPMLAHSRWRLAYFDDYYLILGSTEEFKRQEGRWPWYEGLDPLQAALKKPSARLRKLLEQRLNTQAPDAKGLYLLGLAYLHESRFKEARLAFLASLELDPSQELVKQALQGLPG